MVQSIDETLELASIKISANSIAFIKKVLVKVKASLKIPLHLYQQNIG